MSLTNNELINETSPYLLQHAYNPVSWKAFSPEAWDKAKQENKLVLISIGYSACHWCHVMERESFEDEKIAEFMNEYFICLKVDREERPDVDHIYMEACTIMTKKGGWPLNVFTLPDGRPIYAGTYFTKSSWWGLLRELAIGYKKDPNKYQEFATKLELAINTGNKSQFLKEINPEDLKQDDLEHSLENAIYSFDRINGGKGRAPKFPMPNNLIWLLNNLDSKFGIEIKDIVSITLEKMALGGIYDQIGGGFARYSVDDEWHIPHFEKMLYDNAQLLELYAKGMLLNIHPEICEEVINGIYNWLQSEMLNGGYYSAIDADSEHKEGKFYIWSKEEINAVLSPMEFEFADRYYSLDKASFWEEEGLNHLRRVQNDEQFISQFNYNPEEFLSLKSATIQKLFIEREKRIKPGIDTKIIFSWNCLLISGLCEAYKSTSQIKYLQEAERLTSFLMDNYFKDGKIVRTYRKNIPIFGFLEDYATFIQALIKLYQLTFEESYLIKSKELLEYVLNNFNQENGFFYYSIKSDDELFTSKLEIQDNVIPASNSIMGNNLFYLGKIFSNDIWINHSLEMVKKLIPQIKEYGNYFSNWAILFKLHQADFYEIVISKASIEESKSLGLDIFQTYTSEAYILLNHQENSVINQVEGKSVNGIYLCQGKTCSLAVQTIQELSFN